VRGGLDETLARMARREELLRRRTGEADGGRAEPVDDRAGPKPEEPAPAEGPLAVGRATGTVSWAGPTIDLFGAADERSGTGDDSGRQLATIPLPLSGGAGTARGTVTAAGTVAPPVGVSTGRGSLLRGGGSPRNSGTVQGTGTGTGSGAGAVQSNGNGNGSGAGADPIGEVVEAVRRVVATHPGVSVTLRVEHGGQTYPMRVSWVDGSATVTADPTLAAPPAWPMSVKTVPGWGSVEPGLAEDPAARLAEMIRRNPNLLDDGNQSR